MTTADKNAEIAKFMQYDGHMYDRDLKYHSDWNWLMGVVEKIENLQYQNNNDVFKVVIDYGVCIIYNMINDLEVIVNVTERTKIEAVHEAVFEFIQWYNQNKS